MRFVSGWRCRPGLETALCGRVDLSGGRAGRTPEDLEIQGFGLRRWVGAELLREETPAALVHSKRFGRVAGGYVRLHQRAVVALAERLELCDLGRVSNAVPE